MEPKLKLSDKWQMKWNRQQPWVEDLQQLVFFNFISLIWSFFYMCLILMQRVKSCGRLIYSGDFSLCAIIKDRNPLCASGKIQRSSAPLLQLFRVLHATSVSSGSNAIKLQVWKDENALKFKYVINFFEHLNDFKWKNSKLESCRSCRDL